MSGFLLPVVIIGLFAGTAIALQCFKCGQYNDGVGSITPCTNYSHMQIINCPSLDHVYCIKYLSEGSSVRDCVANCVEKETWSAKTYCCKEDGCNSSPVSTAANYILAFAATIASVLLTSIH